ncbi:hypothetical protein GCM10027610_023530 [Dactylosporangium cerinum]
MYHPDDPEPAAHAVVLGTDEARHIGDLLAATATVEHLVEPRALPAGITVTCIRIAADSPYHDRPLRDVCARCDPSVCLVAVIGDDRVVPAPDPAVVLHRGDTLILAGDPAAVTEVADLLGAGGVRTPAR